MTELWRIAFFQPMEGFFRKLGALLPHLLATLVLTGVGWAAAMVAGSVTGRLLKVARFDPFCVRIGFAQALAKGGVRETPSTLAGRIVYWAIFLIFFLLGLGALELRPVDGFLEEIFSYIPRVVVAATILVLGFIFGNFFGRATLIGAVNAQISQARFLARAVRLSILFFALAMSFEQLGIATSIIVASFSITFGGVVLALAIAFGLGSKDAAKAFIEKRIDEKPEANENDIAHL